MKSERSGVNRWLWPGAALLPLLLFLLSAPACTSPGPAPPATAVIDLLELTPPQVPAGEELHRAVHQVWDFSKGLPEHWRAGPQGVAVQLDARGGGVLLTHPHQLPWLEWRSPGHTGQERHDLAEGIDPLRFGQLKVTLSPHGGATEGALYYSFADPARYERNLRSRVKFQPDAGPSEHYFNLPRADGFETPILLFRLYPSLDQGGARVSRAALQSRDRDYLAGHVLGRGRVGLGQDYRRCWRLVGPGVRQAALQLPAGPAALRFAAGCLAGEAVSRITVELEDQAGAVHPLAGVEAGRPGAGWAEHGADLQRWSGERITLRFRVEADDPGSVTLIGSPAVLTVPQSGPDGARPNVLLILVDTLRADRLSMYGGAARTSPHLDRLAGRGVLFTSAFAPSSWTLPSVAALLTGRYPGRLEVGTGKGAELPEGVPTLAEGFSRAGYDTAGLSANCILNPLHGYARGFDAFYLAPYKDYTMAAGRLNQRAEAWLAARGRRPFFCYLHYMDPHGPYAPPGSGRRPPSNADSFHPHKVGSYREGNIHPLVMGHEALASVDHVAGIARAYDDEVRYVDHQIGRLLAALRRQGLLANTVVAVVADHGEELHDRGFWSHGYTLYQEQLHVPLLLSLPPELPLPAAAVGRQRVHTPVSLVDLMPTLFDLAGLERSGWPTDGRNLFQAPEERGLVSETWAGNVPPRFALRQGPYKYVFFNRKAGEGKKYRKLPARWIWESGPETEELYNLESDPGELRNLAAKRPKVTARMRLELKRRIGPADGSGGGPAGGGKEKTLDPDTEERLRALGYIE